MQSEPGTSLPPPETPSNAPGIPREGGNLFVGRLCTVCKHPARAAIDRALCAGVSERTVAAQFGLSRGAIQRHRANHITAALRAAEAERARAEAEAGLERARAARRERIENPVSPEEAETLLAAANTANARAALVAEAARGEDLLGSLSLLRHRAIMELERASRAGDRKTAIAGVNAARQIVEAMGRITGALNDAGGMTVNIVSAPAFITIQQHIIAALAPFPDAKEAVLKALSQVH